MFLIEIYDNFGDLHRRFISEDFSGLPGAIKIWLDGFLPSSWYEEHPDINLDIRVEKVEVI